MYVHMYIYICVCLYVYRESAIMSALYNILRVTWRTVSYTNAQVLSTITCKPMLVYLSIEGMSNLKNAAQCVGVYICQNENNLYLFEHTRTVLHIRCHVYYVLVSRLLSKHFDFFLLLVCEFFICVGIWLVISLHHSL